MNNKRLVRRQLRKLQSDKPGSLFASAYKVYPNGTVMMTNGVRCITLRRFLPDKKPGVYGIKESKFPDVTTLANTPPRIAHAPLRVVDLGQLTGDSVTFSIRDGRAYKRDGVIQEDFWMIKESVVFTLSVNEVHRIVELAEMLDVENILVSYISQNDPIYIDIRKDCVVAIAPLRLS